MGILESSIGMPLYDVPRESKIRVLGEIKIPPEAPEIKIDDILTFHYLDGMYAQCTNSEGVACELAGWTKVEIIKEKEE